MTSRPDDHRIRVRTPTRVLTDAGARDVTVEALSARGALLFAPAPIGHVGRVVDLALPSLNGRELLITAGIERVDPVKGGEAVAVQFMIADVELRRGLNELLALLLDGTGGGTRRHPRVIYDVRVRLGPDGERIGRLEEISLSGASLRIGGQLPAGTPLVFRVPLVSGATWLKLVGRVVQQRLALDGGYHTGVAFDALDDATRVALSRLLADLMCR